MLQNLVGTSQTGSDSMSRWPSPLAGSPHHRANPSTQLWHRDTPMAPGHRTSRTGLAVTF
ncbi:MAG: hypothetical protein R3E96_16945 [Planctomycetota bacterium]